MAWNSDAKKLSVEGHANLMHGWMRVYLADLKLTDALIEDVSNGKQTDQVVLHIIQRQGIPLKSKKGYLAPGQKEGRLVDDGKHRVQARRQRTRLQIRSPKIALWH